MSGDLTEFGKNKINPIGSLNVYDLNALEVKLVRVIDDRTVIIHVTMKVDGSDEIPDVLLDRDIVLRVGDSFNIG